ncbi:AmmeMemoRadiSam system protein A [Oceanotoga sp. DSM 15011]|jgi:hypothetical protein|uniref:AMMECR1 domain-containing protein n=1 Tax=Oceanotoga teriensis TaxID=515440 RepID=A0AA45C777_9BACT|nr:MULTISPECIES: AmmeMemoRadiSam system protein A [Oceanotoga]MDN5343073.1 uncharacterized protein [Oceanotoga sp.]MDO7976717.1 AmmeMemoRadiSam system protein A [Oceanotoga teriensis]PWJ95238.1 hypothetical protein C7380_10645 [Oceanotoga teriensis]UYP00636.1 AmmeMemoRadiSam system protein A [Oceanotoga sp. DSM 15011]
MREKHFFCQYAREIIQNYIIKNEIQDIRYKYFQKEFEDNYSCFVTLHTLEDELRGCIGTIIPQYKNLYEEIKHNSILASIKDYRFPPLKEEELNNIYISIDILTPLKKIENIKELDPVKYGIMVEHDYKKGVLLPNLDGINTIEDQIRIAKLKAGLNYDEKVDIYSFETKRYF